MESKRGVINEFVDLIKFDRNREAIKHKILTHPNTQMLIKYDLI